MANNEHIQSIVGEFHGDEEKLIKKIAVEGTPSFSPSEEFKNKLDTKIQGKIKLTQQHRQEQAALDAVPKNLKWRFYLTGYGYAIVSFLALFLIGFCTNIFTGTLKVPTKYNYIQQDQAFGNLNGGGELAYYQNEETAKNFSYDADIDEIADEEMITGTSASLESINTSMKKIFDFNNIEGATMYAASIDAGNSEEFNSYGDYLLADSFTYNQTYRFAYKNKLFPKLNAQYPVYKSNGILMGSNTPNQVLKNLKIGNVSFKNFQDLDIMNIEMEQSVENGYNISFDNRNMKLDFYPNSSRKVTQYSAKLPSKKQIIKNVEKDLKNLGITLNNYGEGEVNFQDYDDNMGIVQIFYPFIIEGKAVRNAESNQQIGMQVAYDLNLQKVVSVIGMDIATYDVSNYPILDKKVIESAIENGGEFFKQGALHENSTVVLFDNMEVVYIEKALHEDKVRTIYVPAIRATVSTSIENYKSPSVVYQEII